MAKRGTADIPNQTMTASEERDLWKKNYYRLDAKTQRLRAFVAEVRKHIDGACDGSTPSDCIEAITMSLVTLDESKWQGGDGDG